MSDPIEKLQQPDGSTPMPPGEPKPAPITPQPPPQPIAPAAPPSAFDSFPPIEAVRGGSEAPGGGATVQDTLNTIVAPRVQQQVQQQQQLQQRINAGVVAATQENTYPNVYTPPNFDQIQADFRSNADWQSRVLQQQLRDADERSRSDAAFAQMALDRLKSIPTGGSTQDAFQWVRDFLGMSKEGGREYILPLTGRFADGTAKWNIPATFLFGLGLAQNTAMGAALDLRNLTAAAYNAAAPWVRNSPGWLRDFVAGSSDSQERALVRAVAGWLNSPTNKRYNDGKSNTIEAIRGAQFSFTDDAGAGVGIKQNWGWRAGAPEGKGWGFDVNPSALVGFGLDVLVGLKVDKALGPLIGRGASRTATTGTETIDAATRGAQRAELRAIKREAEYLQAFPEVGRYRTSPKPTGKAVDYTQLELPFVPAKPTAKQPAKPATQELGGMTRERARAFNPANRQEAKRIRQMQQAQQRTAKPQQLELLDTLPEALKYQPRPVAVSNRVRIEVPRTPVRLEVPKLAQEWSATREVPLSQVLAAADARTPLARALSTMPPTTPLEQALKALPPTTPLEQVLKLLPPDTPLQQALSQLPKASTLEDALRTANAVLRDAISVGGIRVSTAPQGWIRNARRLGLLRDAGTAQSGSRALDELATTLGVTSMDEVAIAFDDLLKSGLEPETVREALDALPGVVSNSASTQALADVANANLRGQFLRQVAANVDQSVKAADTALDATDDIGRKFIGSAANELPPPPKLNAVNRSGVEIPTKYDLPLAEAPAELFHGTRVANHVLSEADPIVGAARSELGTGHYLSTTKKQALIASRADSARNLPDVGRPFGEPTVIEAGLAPNARIIDAKAEVGEMSLLASRVGAEYPELAGAFNGKMSLVQVYDQASKLLSEADALRFQRQMAMGLTSLGYDGARAGKILSVYNPKAIIQRTGEVVQDVSAIGQRTSRTVLEDAAAEATGSAFSRSAAADAKLAQTAQVAEELDAVIRQEASDTANAIGRSGLWDDVVVSTPAEQAALEMRPGFTLTEIPPQVAAAMPRRPAQLEAIQEAARELVNAGDNVAADMLDEAGEAISRGDTPKAIAKKLAAVEDYIDSPTAQFARGSDVPLFRPDPNAQAVLDAETALRNALDNPETPMSQVRKLQDKLAELRKKPPCEM